MKLNDDINKFRTIMGLPIKEEQLHEGLLDNIKSVGSGITNAMKSVSNNYQQGRTIKELEAELTKAQKVIDQVDAYLEKNEQLFANMKQMQEKLNQLNVDAPTKQKYNNLFAAADAVFHSLKHVTEIQKQGMDDYRNQQTQNKQNRTQQKSNQSTQNRDFHPNDSMDDLDDFLSQRNVSEMLDRYLNEAAHVQMPGVNVPGSNKSTDSVHAENPAKDSENHKKLFSALASISTDMGSKAAQKMGPGFNSKATGVIMAIAFKALAQMDHAKFFQFVRAAGGDVNLYKRAYKILNNPNPQLKPQNTDTSSSTTQAQTSANSQPQPEPQQAPPPPVDRTAEAKQLASEYLKKKGYRETPDAISHVTQQILSRLNKAAA